MSASWPDPGIPYPVSTAAATEARCTGSGQCMLVILPELGGGLSLPGLPLSTSPQQGLLCRQEVFPKSRPIPPCFTFLMGLMPASQRELSEGQSSSQERLSRERLGLVKPEKPQFKKQLGKVRFQQYSSTGSSSSKAFKLLPTPLLRPVFCTPCAECGLVIYNQSPSFLKWGDRERH